MSDAFFSLAFKASFLTLLVSSLLVVYHAMRSAKTLGGTLGQGLKKVAAGTTLDTIMIITYMLLERGDRGILNDEQIRLFFVTVGIFGAALLIAGYLQIYRISKRLKLFTV
ncbi:hypothetical protein M1523_04620 [Patescibacteria group bacterium]|nr:hypothetical protein [Patescibacteria group bacterium]